MKTVVMVHDRAHDDPNKIAKLAGLGSAFSALSFTDRVTSHNPHNSELFDSVLRADVVILPQSHLGKLTSDTEVAMKGILSAVAGDQNVVLYNDDYTLFDEQVVILPGSNLGESNA